MSEVVRNIYIGRLAVPILIEGLSQTLGEEFQAVGGGVVPGERRPRGYAITLPVQGASGDSDTFDTGVRMRRQVLGLLGNTRYRASGLYFSIAADREIQGWLMIGGGTLAQEPAALARAKWRLELTDVFYMGSENALRLARRLTLLDRRLGTTPRDFLQGVFDTDFSNQTALAIHYLPTSAYDLTTGFGTPLYPGAGPAVTAGRTSMGGVVPFIIGRSDAEIVHFEMARASSRADDVVIFDRRGNYLPTASAVLTNQVNNPTLRIGTGSTIFTASNGRVQFDYPNPLYAYQPWGIKVSTAVSGTGTEHTSISVVNGQRYYFRARVWVESVVAGVNMGLRVTNGAGTQKAIASTTTSVPGYYLLEGEVVADATASDWRLRFFSSGTGAVVAYATELMMVAIPSTGIKVDFFDGDSDWSRWTGTPGNSPSEKYDDPQAAYGWEEVYGPDQPLADLDVPVLQNGICRIRQKTLTQTVPQIDPGVFSVDAFVAGTGWVEQGRVQVRIERPLTTYATFDTLREASVVEWTPERAVIRVILGFSTEGTVKTHCDVYITLQRGWAGPTFDVYMRDAFVGAADKPGVEIMYLPVGDGTTDGNTSLALPVGSNTTGVAAIFNDPSGTWNGQNMRTLAATDETWVYLLPSGTMLGTTLWTNRAGPQMIRWNDSNAFGASRRGLAVHAGLGDQTIAGYAHMGIGYGPRGGIVEAEAGTLGTGTLNADALAAPGSGNSAIDDVAVAEGGGASVTITSATLDALGYGMRGVVGVWARVKVVTAGATGHVKVRFGANVIGDITYTSTTYVWVYVGVLNRGGGEALDIRIWRSAGTGTVRIDRLLLAPAELRSTSVIAASSYDGARDFGAAALYDARQVQEIVHR